MDALTKQDRSHVMSRIRSKDTKPELVIRKMLFRLGFRYRLHDSKLPGKPDIVLPKYKTAILVHGCFWHLHNNCRDGRFPKSKLEYWKPKLTKNVERDKENQKALAALGWKILIVWECEINKELDKVILKVLEKLGSKITLK